MKTQMMVGRNLRRELLTVVKKNTSMEKKMRRMIVMVRGYGDVGHCIHRKESVMVHDTLLVSFYKPTT